MTAKMTKEEIARSTKLRCIKAFGWLTIDETQVIKHALENYIKLGPDSSWPIQLARELLKDIP